MAQGRSTQVISMIKWIWTTRLSLKNSLSLDAWQACDEAAKAAAKALEKVPHQALQTLSHARYWSPWLVLGAILWAFIAKRYQNLQILNFD